MYRYLWCVFSVILTIPQLHMSVRTQDGSLYFGEINMIDSRVGWGIAVDEVAARILFTRDGGETWHTVLSHLFDGSRYAPQLVEGFFLDAHHAWISFPPLISIWVTHDGGISWLEVTITDEPIFSTQGIFAFVDHDHGWFLAQDCCAAGNEFARLYQTTNGGMTWELINDTEQGRGLVTDYHTGMVFADETHGWMTTSSLGAYGGVSYTDDGGENWQDVVLPAAKAEDIKACQMYSPFVYPPDDVLFIARCQTGDVPAVYLYHTIDRGQSWKSIPIGIESVNGIGGVVMLDPLIGWLAGESNNSLYTTHDGGQHWTTISPLPTECDFARRLDFSDELNGWATCDDTLFRTENGGQSWEMLSPSVDAD